MLKQVRAEQTRDAIVRGAAEAFDKHGFVGATLGDVTTYAEVTKGAVYFHFRSKEELARAVIDASGTWRAPNPAGANGIPATGERDM